MPCIRPAKEPPTYSNCRKQRHNNGLRRDTHDDDVVKLAFHDFRRVFATVTGWDKNFEGAIWEICEKERSVGESEDLAMDNFDIPTCLRDCGATCEGAS